MPRINLLPARKLARQEDLRREIRVLCYIAVGLVCAIFAHALLQSERISSRQAGIAAMAANNDAAAKRLKELDELKKGIGLLHKKLDIIDLLASNKQGPSMVLGTFADVLSEHPRIWLNRFEQSGDLVRLNGNAMAQEDISSFQATLASKAPILSDVTLLLVNSGKDGSEARVLEWSMTCRAHTLGPGKPQDGNGRPT